ncbi:paraquat-inducible protein A [Pseudooctadecabacter jejudonensis]|uniref:Paraquat-inducible protein A n=1 Tax=Pseudooctadecabacter jejudonensis TaxID=1391910 RepID=A0A1Y5RIM6_9RHOB|nr:paraquat-inducible protein A [Pseudooctadecabacter jejudonensis]SLN18195.1 Paraquat-inducible protein A [Pseudooctadecabacter jejudonensis]
MTDVSTDHLIGCPQCDAVYSVTQTQAGQQANCTRCGHRLIAPRSKAGMQIIMLNITIAVLVVAAAVFPFLTISAAGLSNSVSILQAALAFSDGILVLLALATAALIIFIPLLRVLLSLYVLIPVVFDRPPARGAARAFRLSEALRPWSMAEIFAIGCAVALVKVTDLADVQFGPAFWMFTVLVFLVVLQDTFLCRWSVWNSLDKSKA